MDQVFSLFSGLLAERLRSDVFTTEDSVRHTFVHALLSSGFCSHTDVVMEAPHPMITGAKIDIAVRSLAFEFKYDRKIPSKKNPPSPQKAGASFADIFRLAKLPPSATALRYFIPHFPVRITIACGKQAIVLLP